MAEPYRPALKATFPCSLTFSAAFTGSSCSGLVEGSGRAGDVDELSASVGTVDDDELVGELAELDSAFLKQDIISVGQPRANIVWNVLETYPSTVTRLTISSATLDAVPFGEAVAEAAALAFGTLDLAFLLAMV